MPDRLLHACWLLAQAAEAGAGDAAGDGAGGGAGGSGQMLQMLAPFAIIFMLFYFMIIRPEKRKQAEHKLLLEAIKKNDRVVTIGGIYGVVMNVDRKADRVSLKIDEATNAKMEVTFSSISRVIVDEPAKKES